MSINFGAGRRGASDNSNHGLEPRSKVPKTPLKDLHFRSKFRPQSPPSGPGVLGAFDSYCTVCDIQISVAGDDLSTLYCSPECQQKDTLNKPHSKLPALDILEPDLLEHDGAIAIDASRHPQASHGPGHGSTAAARISISSMSSSSTASVNQGSYFDLPVTSTGSYRPPTPTYWPSGTKRTTSSGTTSTTSSTATTTGTTVPTGGAGTGTTVIGTGGAGTSTIASAGASAIAVAARPAPAAEIWDFLDSPDSHPRDLPPSDDDLALVGPGLDIATPQSPLFRRHSYGYATNPSSFASDPFTCLSRMFSNSPMTTLDEDSDFPSGAVTTSGSNGPGTAFGANGRRHSVYVRPSGHPAMSRKNSMTMDSDVNGSPGVDIPRRRPLSLSSVRSYSGYSDSPRSIALVLPSNSNQNPATSGSLELEYDFPRATMHH